MRDWVDGFRMLVSKTVGTVVEKVLDELELSKKAYLRSLVVNILTSLLVNFEGL